MNFSGLRRRFLRSPPHNLQHSSASNVLLPSMTRWTIDLPLILHLENFLKTNLVRGSVWTFFIKTCSTFAYILMRCMSLGRKKQEIEGDEKKKGKSDRSVDLVSEKSRTINSTDKGPCISRPILAPSVTLFHEVT